MANQRCTVVIGADLQRLVSAHNQSRLAILLMFQQPDITSTTLLPLVRLASELEELSSHLERLLLEFFVGLDIDFLCKTNDRLEMNIFGLRSFILWRLNIELSLRNRIGVPLDFLLQQLPSGPWQIPRRLHDLHSLPSSLSWHLPRTLQTRYQ